MLIKDLKPIIKNYNEEELNKIIIALYKKIPKRIKEEYDIDNYILNIKEPKSKSKEIKEKSITDLEQEVSYFLKCANMDFYASPNRVISKKERSGWHLKVKRYYKELNEYAPDTEDGNIATDLLKDLYLILSKGTYTLVFTNWSTFRAIGVSQSEFLINIVKRKLANGISPENISYCLELLDTNYDSEEYHLSILLSFISSLRANETKELAIPILIQQIEEKKVAT